MHVAVYCPLLVSLVVGRCGPRLARRLPPATATRLLVGAGALTAAATGSVLALLAFTLVARLPGVAARGHWSTAALADAVPVPRVVAVAASAVLLLAVVRTLSALTRQLSALWAARAFCRASGGTAGQLLLVDDDVAAAAVPGDGGRVLASRAQLAALPADERRALLAHEGAHLAYRHHLHRLVAELVAAADPGQRRLPGAVAYATERWADEVAAAGLGDRAVVARALARSGLRASGMPRSTWSAVVLHSGGSRVVPRVQALLRPAPRQRPLLVAGAAVLVAFALGTAVHAQADTEDVVEHAVLPAALHPAASSPAALHPAALLPAALHPAALRPAAGQPGPAGVIGSPEPAGSAAG